MLSDVILTDQGLYIYPWRPLIYLGNQFERMIHTFTPILSSDVKVVKGNPLVVWPNISSVVEFKRWWVLKSKFFAQESTCSMEILILTTLN